MSNEKVLAFYQSWGAMWLQAFKFQLSIAQSAASASLGPFADKRRSAVTPRKTANAAARVLAAGLAPVHGKAVANSRRLARKRR